MVAAVLLAACGGDSDVQAEDEKLVIVIGAAGAIDTPWHEGWRRFERRVNDAAYPGLELQMFVNSQLGTEENHTRQCAPRAGPVWRNLTAWHVECGAGTERDSRAVSVREL